MGEGKLTVNQRARLEALKQAVNSSAGSFLSADEIIQRAQLFEHYILLGKR